MNTDEDGNSPVTDEHIEPSTPDGRVDLTGGRVESIDGSVEPAEAGGRVEVVHDRPAHLATTVVQAVSEATGVPADAMETDLGDVVDPDALNHLFSDRLDGRSRRGGRVAFTMLGCRVEVDADGRVVVDPQ